MAKRRPSKRLPRPIDILRDKPPRPQWEVQRAQFAERARREGFSCRIMSRGEEVVYRVGARRFSVDISWRDGLTVYFRGRTTWDDGTPMTPEERALARERVVAFLECESAVTIVE